MKYDIEILNDYISRGLLEKNPHPSLPIAVYNYSREVQYENNWDDITLAMRGTIIDDEGYVVASAFPKFFNYEEVADKVPLRGDYVYVQEKVDGSLGLLFYYADEWHLATKGSFTSDQAKRGMEILKEKYKLFDQIFMAHVTYIVEIIYPENRIVVDYKGKDKIVFLSTSIDGVEQHWTTSLSIFKGSGIKKNDIVKCEQHFSFGEDLYKSLKEKDTRNEEGFVLLFQPYFRMKIKFNEYVRLHRLLTNFSNVDIWELLKNGEDLDKFLERVPDEFDKWVKGTISSLQYHKYQLEERAGKIHDYFRYGKYNDRETVPTKKEFAEHLENCKVEQSIRAICFAIWDKKDYDHIIWKLLRPKYQKPFWNKEEDPIDSKWNKKEE
jgi:RNA ligase